MMLLNISCVFLCLVIYKLYNIVFYNTNLSECLCSYLRMGENKCHDSATTARFGRNERSI